jgi:hypothetical protein
VAQAESVFLAGHELYLRREIQKRKVKIRTPARLQGCGTRKFNDVRLVVWKGVPSATPKIARPGWVVWKDGSPAPGD